MLDDCPPLNPSSHIKPVRDEDADQPASAHLNLSLNYSAGGPASRFVCAQSLGQGPSASTSTPASAAASNSLALAGNFAPQPPPPGGSLYKQQDSDHHNHHPSRHQHAGTNQPPARDEQYYAPDETNSSNLSLNPPIASAHQHAKVEAPEFSCANMLANGDHGPSRQAAMVPTTAHCSDQHNLHYSLSSSKAISAPSPSNMALNFSHDLLLPHGHAGLHQQAGDNGEHKSGQLELDSGNLMQSAAANMNIWKSTVNFGLKHSAISEPAFLPAADMNSFSNWTHGGNLNHHAAPNMTHHILESQHLIGYPPHNQRALHLNNQDLGATLKSQVCEQASFVLSSINSSAASSQAPHTSQHALHPPGDGHQHLRSQSLEQSANAYNISMSDQFYSSRSHGGGLKSAPFLQDRAGPMGLVAGQPNHISYHSTEHLNPQPTTSHHVAGSSGGASKNLGSFRCPHCSELFNMRNLYQSHLKTHSQEKGTKAKFHCELCGHSFSQKTSLNRHMKSHTGERPFPCEVCGKAFSEKERLKIHMRTHTGEKPFSCGICGKSFSQKSTVKRHQTVHTGEKKFKCDCGKGFANRGNLIAHIKTRGTHHFE